ncbi:hypothetical protein ECL_02671 [Enterobacter cloacae subsp. cloacae ATCC 13047]|uniref:Uncharacterized protein n=1 Tax=Enterobacter cloacae subsp. cloacae (strain ATCC 13047 / DSM 30054 / NBRC 13535 / NCTC 10005 / WDCM 00083 / NCDC 279-56) TaxID=716541 RepID=A0A0H3CLL1_ENTCC|nr:hypothetical protein ECL_02671 [Enterobacter cloacae subsp. cloacae ATCC 13047]
MIERNTLPAGHLPVPVMRGKLHIQINVAEVSHDARGRGDGEQV